MPLEKRRPNPPQRFDPFSAERRRSPELPPRARPIRATSALRGGKKHVSVSYVTCFFARSHAQIHVGKKKVAYLCSSFLSFTAPLASPSSEQRASSDFDRERGNSAKRAADALHD